ncbi:glycosyltransferase family 31 protein [Xylariomycetidae sp. FL0641]|nr:glycosyltransferase family 31 protein [Xylariomycetidae sp. FL0641]
MGWVEAKRFRSLTKRFSRPQKLALSAIVFLLLCFSLTPYDSRVRSAVRFGATSATDYWQARHPTDAWLHQPQRYPIDPDKDVGVVVKTGYGTRNRVPVTLQALSNESFYADTVVIQDYPPFESQDRYYLANGKEVPAVDIIGWSLETGAVKKQVHWERVVKYQSLADAIEAEGWMLADIIGKNFGWELDAMKFLPGLEYAWKTMPNKKWYLMLDDDTYLIKPSFMMLAQHLDPKKPQYIGNPVGDYKGRFPHGGSSVIISGAALAKLFDGRHKDVVAEGNREAPTSIWGDKLLSTTFMKLGIYLDETYKRMFNGETPWMTRMWIDRMCLPLLGFHGLGHPDAMQATSETFGGITEPVYWRSLGAIYGAPNYASFVSAPFRGGVDYVGRLDEWSTTVVNVTDMTQCRNICEQHSDECLAWTFDPPAYACHYAPWHTIGDIIEGRFSGINGKLGQKLVSQCHASS